MYIVERFHIAENRGRSLSYRGLGAVVASRYSELALSYYQIRHFPYIGLERQEAQPASPSQAKLKPPLGFNRTSFSTKHHILYDTLILFLQEAASHPIDCCSLILMLLTQRESSALFDQ